MTLIPESLKRPFLFLKENILNNDLYYCDQGASDKKILKHVSQKLIPFLQQTHEEDKNFFSLYYSSKWLERLTKTNIHELAKYPHVFMLSLFSNHNLQYEKICHLYYKKFAFFLSDYPEYLSLYQDTLLRKSDAIKAIFTYGSDIKLKDKALNLFLDNKLILISDPVLYGSCFSETVLLSHFLNFNEHTDQKITTLLLHYIHNASCFEEEHIFRNLINNHFIYNSVFLKGLVASENFFPFYLSTKESLFTYLLFDITKKYAKGAITSEQSATFLHSINHNLEYFNFSIPERYGETFFNTHPSDIDSADYVKGQLHMIALFKHYNPDIYQNLGTYLSNGFFDSLNIDIQILLEYVFFPANECIIYNIYKKIETPEHFYDFFNRYENKADLFYAIQKFLDNPFLYNFKNTIDNKCNDSKDNIFLTFDKIMKEEIIKIDLIYHALITNRNPHNDYDSFCFLCQLFCFYSQSFSVNDLSVIPCLCQLIRNHMIELIFDFIKTNERDLGYEAIRNFIHSVNEHDKKHIKQILNINEINNLDLTALVPLLRRQQLSEQIIFNEPETKTIARNRL